MPRRVPRAACPSVSPHMVHRAKRPGNPGASFPGLRGISLAAMGYAALLIADFVVAGDPTSQASHDAADSLVRCRNGAVVSVSPLASQVGLHVLERGGSAVDAAVATAFALAVTYPPAGNIGGGGYMLVVPDGPIRRAPSSIFAKRLRPLPRATCLSTVGAHAAPSRGNSRHGARPGAGARALWPPRLARAGDAGGGAGTRRL